MVSVESVLTRALEWTGSQHGILEIFHSAGDRRFLHFLVLVRVECGPFESLWRFMSSRLTCGQIIRFDIPVNISQETRHIKKQRKNKLACPSRENAHDSSFYNTSVSVSI